MISKDNHENLIQAIQGEAMGSNPDVCSLLRRCLVLSRRVSSLALETWTNLELDGYPLEAEVPKYRLKPLSVVASFIGPFGTEVKGYTVAPLQLPERVRAHTENFPFRSSLAAAEALIANGHSSHSLSAQDLQFLLNDVFENMTCISARYDLSRVAVVEIKDSVLSAILRFALDIERELSRDPSGNLSSVVDETVMLRMYGYDAGAQ